MGGDEYTGYRLTALWEPLDQLSVTLGYMQQEIEQDGFPEVHLDLAESFQQTSIGTGPGGSRDEYLNNELDITNLVLEYDLGWGSITSSSSWVNNDSFGETDLSGLFFAPYYGVYYIDQEAFIEELRFSSKFDGPFQILAGLYYEDSDKRSNGPWLWGGDVTVSDPTVPFLVVDERTSLEQTAVFAEFTYEFSDQLNATVGIRHFDYDQEFVNLGFFGAFPLTGDNNLQESDQTYKASLSYSPNEDLLVYGQWVEGFRLGQAAAAPSPFCDADNDGILDDVGFSDPGPLKSDRSENFELGIKTSLADNRVTVNAAIYRIDWQDMPISIDLPSCGSKTRLNAGESKSEGVELEVQARLTEKFQLDFSASYGESTLAKDQINLGEKGDNLPGSADFNISIGLEYSFILAGSEAFVRGDYAYISEYYNTVTVDETDIAAGGYGQLNLKTGTNFNAFDIDLFVNNLTNENDFTAVNAEYGGSNRAYRLRPRTVGLSVAYQF